MKRFQKAEIWVATGIYLFAWLIILFPVLTFDQEAMYSEQAYSFRRNDIHYDFILHTVWPQLLFITAIYGGFMSLNFWVAPQFIQHGRISKGIWTGGLVVVTCFLMVMVGETWWYGYVTRFPTVSSFHAWCAGRAAVIMFVWLLGFAVYTLVKTILPDFIDDPRFTRYFRIKPRADMVVLIIFWLACIVFFLLDRSPARMQFIIWAGSAYLVAYYYLSRNFFEPLFRKERSWMQLAPNALVIITVTFVAACFMCDITTNIRHMFQYYIIILIWELLAVVPLAWVVTRLRLRQKNEVLVLEKALGRSSANLDFLRSQINPHFLFNALNTLYGTALQERASRTSEGIQRLGDMMRFMLHENVEEKIHLSKEVAYLQNYIALQRLRTQESPDIKIEVNITESGYEHAIAPMLLIPFVENAFKHGISLRNRSWIVVSLSCDAEHIYFDAYNSVHPRPDNDPEKNSLGIGLNNVRHRLQHLYPGRHELSIRQTNTEFFVHLTITTQKAAATA